MAALDGMIVQASVEFYTMHYCLEKQIVKEELNQYRRTMQKAFLMTHFKNYKEGKIRGRPCCDNCARCRTVVAQAWNRSSSCNNWVVMNTSMKQASNEQVSHKV